MREPQSLSKRLAAVASFIPIGTRIADIGTDHAYLPVYLALQGKISTAIAGDVNEGPLALAKAHVQQYQLESVIDVRKGDGLEVIAPGEVDVIVIAGMGGSLMQEILSRGQDKLEGVRRLVVQPNVSAHVLRMWMMEHGWELKGEKIVDENGKYYEILMAEPGDGETPYAELSSQEKARAILMGPFLLAEKNEVFKRKWQQEYELRKRILSSLKKSESEASQEKREHIEQELRLIEGGIAP
ncbi:protein of unknown function DUF633 [Caldalkalibacillus thermarum TA2.A1]|uniref:Class I SAM-dependent methyltransferase n=1 Tax=Caldalkalibacillus thermarum (strain TA2.A1) TaxID=986075 RepID=F5L5F9_CALTT|nr:class I SAM-dependent methyltransferase [Caldalkalibacillus thermarum]EGL83424.1 protein of unknown function DUF633 [Caldalkalibacillus thermarum TA2.A1]QZT33359.1 class I SAM-dependent methyltransferase [Caldalkalibacillus thermarum TA2.A1]